MHKLKRYIKTASVRPYAASMKLLAFIPLHPQLQVDGLYQM